MFNDLLATDFFKLISEQAKTTIREDRDNFKDIFDETRLVIKDDPLIIVSNVNKIIGETKDENEINMVLYTTHTRRTTTNISNQLHRKFGKFVQMRSIIPNEEYEIMYDMRGLIKIHHIEKYKNVDIPQLFNAVSISGINYFPVEIELMDVYHKLYLVNFYDEWDKLIKREQVLYNNVAKTFGGGKKCDECSENRKIDINNIKLLMLKFLDNANYVLVGKWAHNIIAGKTKIEDVESDSNLQIISENDIERDYHDIVQYLATYTNYGVYYKKKKIYVPKDTRIHRYSVFIKYPSITGKTGYDRGIDKPFLDIYNCGEYEIIPFIPKKCDDINLRVGNLFVQMRFLLLDLWLFRVLKFLTSMTEDDFNTKCKYIFETMALMKKKLPVDFKNKHDGTYSYMGINYDEKVAQKIVISKENLRKSSYYPEISIKKNNKYKLIATSSM